MPQFESVKEHVWRKDDLCQHWVGIICRVTKVVPGNPMKPVTSKQHHQRLHIVQATPLFGTTAKRGIVPASWCKPLTLVDLGTEYVKLGNFIREQAEKQGME